MRRSFLSRLFSLKDVHLSLSEGVWWESSRFFDLKKIKVFRIFLEWTENGAQWPSDLFKRLRQCKVSNGSIFRCTSVIGFDFYHWSLFDQQISKRGRSTTYHIRVSNLRLSGWILFLLGFSSKSKPQCATEEINHMLCVEDWFSRERRIEHEALMARLRSRLMGG